MAAPQYDPKYRWRKVGGRGTQAGHGGPSHAGFYVQQGTCVASLMGQEGRRAWSFDVTGQGGFRRTGAGYTFEVAQFRAEQAMDACRGKQVNGVGCAIGQCGQIGSLFSDFTGRVSKMLSKHTHKAKRAVKRTAKRGWRTTR